MTAQERQVSPGPAGTVDERLARVAQGVVRVQDFFWPPLPLEVLEACTSGWLRSRGDGEGPDDPDAGGDDAGGDDGVPRDGVLDDGQAPGGAPCPSR
ncbi:hypothetical protein ABID92_002667 [Frigoribacterium sp. PvP120]|uniref:hypothetical protein n=1 Tax=unclassified Frigoribacterium TaxID=2627005 RepID=UPI001AE3A0AD|nr:hypothetical protein [Frigoribacterium sp. PvP121]MBP1240579.1 hypothetical protein [Frigoribacterium sp. PvP121]